MAIRQSFACKLWLLAVLALVVGGCASPSGQVASAGWPWTKKKVDGPPAPSERMEEFRELAEKAADMDDAEKERQSGELASAAGRETDVLIRGEIYRTLGSFSTISSSTALYAGLQDSEPEIRTACCQAWGKRGGADAAKVLGDVLREDESEDVRLAAARALGEIKDQAAVTALAPALDDGSPAMQWRAVRSLEQVTGKYYGEDVNAWRSYVQGGNPRQESIVRRLGRIFY